jgi:hypothetical protein
MKICILGELKYIDEIEYLKNELSSTSNYICIPVLEYEDKKNIPENDVNYYLFVRDCILNSDYILIITEDKKNRSFIFNFGMVFGSKKKFKVILRKNVKILSNKEL